MSPRGAAGLLLVTVVLLADCARSPEERARMYDEYMRGRAMTYGTRGSIQRYERGDAPCKMWHFSGNILMCLD